MDRRLQAHILANIADNGGWYWTWERLMAQNLDAFARFQDSGYTSEEYYTCTVMLVESSLVVSRSKASFGFPDDFDIDARHSPLCLSLDGARYLTELQHPTRQWLKRNWFAMIVAITAALATLSAAVLNTVLQIMASRI